MYWQCYFLQSQEKEVFRVIKIFKYKLKKTSGSCFWQRGKPRAEIKRYNLLSLWSQLTTQKAGLLTLLGSPFSTVKSWVKISIQSGLLGFQNEQYAYLVCSQRGLISQRFNFFNHQYLGCIHFMLEATKTSKKIQNRRNQYVIRWEKEFMEE